MKYPIRINKYLRGKRLASRCEADKLVKNGLVFVNRKCAKNGIHVNENDIVVVKDAKKQCQYFAYYKPAGLATQDFAGRQSVISDWKERGLYPVGRKIYYRFIKTRPYRQY